MTNRHQPRTPGGRFAGGQLTDADTEDIRILALGGESHGRLARRYGVSRSLVTRIVNGTRRAPRKPLGQDRETSA